MSSPTLPRHRSVSSLRAATIPHGRPATDRAAPAAAAASSAVGAPARFRYNRGNATWWWSPEMFAMCGMSPGAAEPCLELLLGHQHPDDHARTLAALNGACDEGRPFCLETRLSVDGDARTVVLVGEPERDASGAVAAISGLVAEISGPRRTDDRDREALITEISQLRTAMASRAAIEQAKGIIMLLTGCGDEVAFRLLSHISSHTHRKVRDVAVAITESASGRSRLPEDVRAILRDACPPGIGMR
jgi:hypothetical protein